MTLVFRQTKTQCVDGVVHSVIQPYMAQGVKPHMDIAIRENIHMRRSQIRQTLAANLAAAMTRSPTADTQQKLARRAKIGQSHISRILRGTSAATVDAVEALASALGLQPWELLADGDATREAALKKMILGPRADDGLVSKHLPPAPGRKQS